MIEELKRDNFIVQDFNLIRKNTSGVYFIFEDEVLIYIGQSHNILHRIRQHFFRMICTHINYIEYKSKIDRVFYEKYFIEKYKPKYNGTYGPNGKIKFNYPIYKEFIKEYYRENNVIFKSKPRLMPQLQKQ